MPPFDGKIRVISLFSGSDGNCTYIEKGNDAFLIDAGRSASEIARSLYEIGSDISKIRAVFVTHEHSDHTSGIKALYDRYGIKSFFTEKCADAYLSKLRSGNMPDVCARKSGFRETVGEITVSSFPVPHDSCECVGYKIDFGSASIGIATDIGYVTKGVLDTFSECSALLIESNHCVDMVKNGSYPPFLKRRILSGEGHLSNDECAKLCVKLAKREGGPRSFMLAHLSKNNNTRETAIETVKGALIEAGIEDATVNLAGNRARLYIPGGKT